MQLPPYLTSVRGPSNSQSQSESISYDYSGMDEINKRKDEAAKASDDRYQQLYGGDVAGSVASSHRIRSLLDSLKDITPVRISSYSNSTDMDGNGGEIGGHHGEDEPPRYGKRKPAEEE